MDTNAILLTADRVEKLCELSLSLPVPLLLVFTIDAHTPMVYKDVKGTDSLLRVRRNIRTLLQKRFELGAECHLNVQIQFVVQEGNSHEAHSFLYYWRDVFSSFGGSWHDELMFKRLSVGGGAQGQAKADELYEKSIFQAGIRSLKQDHLHILCWDQRPWQEDDGHQEGRSACPGPWMTPVIRHDGALMVCCSDLRGELNLGSLQDASFSALWYGEKAQNIRQQHQKKIFEGVCKFCGGINWYQLTEEQIQETDSRAHALNSAHPLEEKRCSTG